MSADENTHPDVRPVWLTREQRNWLVHWNRSASGPCNDIVAAWDACGRIAAGTRLVPMTERQAEGFVALRLELPPAVWEDAVGPILAAYAAATDAKEQA